MVLTGGSVMAYWFWRRRGERRGRWCVSVWGVAETLGLSEDAVRQRLARGREMMRERIESEVEEVLTRTRPTAIFTMVIAAAIGALAAPATVAAAAFSGAVVAGSTCAT